MRLSESRQLITDEDWDWFWDTHDREDWECGMCGGDGVVEYMDCPELWGEDCPSEVNHLEVCPECHRIEIDTIRIILEHKGLLPAPERIRRGK